MGWSAADVISAPPSKPSSPVGTISPVSASPLPENDRAPLERQNEVLSHSASDSQQAAVSPSALSTDTSPTSAAAAAASGVSHARNTAFSASFLRGTKAAMATLPLPLPSAASSTSTTPALSRSSTPVLRASPRVRSTPRTGTTTVPRFALPTASATAHRGELRAHTARTAATSTPSSTSSQRARRRPVTEDGGGLEADDVSLLNSLHEVSSSTTELLTLLFPTDAGIRTKCDEVFRRENVDVTALLMLTQTHLRQMGLTVGVRVKLATAVYVMRKLKGLEVADRGLIDPNSRATARRLAHPHATDVTAAVSKPAQPAVTSRPGKSDTAEQPSAARHVVGTSRQHTPSPIKPRHTSPPKSHATTTTINTAVAAPHLIREVKDKTTASNTAALKARFQALNHKYRERAHSGEREEAEAADGEENEVSPRKTARRLMVERKEVVIDNEEEERKREEKKRAEEERKEKLRHEREKRKEEREQAKAEAARKEADERDEREAERKRREEEREKAAAAEKERRRVEVERAKQDKHKATPKPAETKKEKEPVASPARQHSRGSNSAAEPPRDDREKQQEKKERDRADSSTAVSSSMFRRSATPIVLKRNKKPDGSSGLAVAAAGTEEAKAAEDEVNNGEPAPPSGAASLAKLSLPDIPLSYSTSTSSMVLPSATSSSLSASTSPSSLSSTATSTVSAGEALAKAKARIQAAKEARESLKSASTSPLLSTNSASATPPSDAADGATDSGGEQSVGGQQQQEDVAVDGMDAVPDGSDSVSAVSSASTGATVSVGVSEHKRRVSHVGGLIDQFESVTARR